MTQGANGANHRVQVDYHQMFFAPFDTHPVMTRAQNARLLNISSDGTSLFVSTGCASGTVVLRLKLLTEPPGDLDQCMEGWEIGAEDDFLLTTNLHLGAPTVNMTDPLVVTPSSPGPHRVRVLARGRAEHYDQFVGDSGEEYEVIFWPVESARSRVDAGDDGIGL
ncbi:hypothetical protein JOF29_006066 [Kribbella aluminosa]|uniref:Uncharacterized protein n=1 Tax=Kribbella aluminosa TaxID=416017 RepID=A0ABS4UTS1_9ACTN|nr:hypothetical protein [Kribbella aluminosa]MBP2354956.1 hypothetical protein [Kribbella aluminosa]